eukprot:7780069-Ditylum_brightwellii.AAC.1
MHGRNRTHDTEDCFELKQCVKCAKTNTSHAKANKVSYKDLNAFINTKVTTALSEEKSKKSEERKGS